MTRDEKIEVLLSHMNQWKENVPLLNYCIEKFGNDIEDIRETNLLVDIMIDQDLIKENLGEGMFSISLFGIKVSENGGWINHLKSIEEDNLKKIQREEREFELKVSNKRWLAIATIANIVIGLVNAGLLLYQAFK